LSNQPHLTIKDQGDYLSGDDLNELTSKVSKLTKEHCDKAGDGKEKEVDLSVL
jgi:hypothetical protein